VDTVAVVRTRRYSRSTAASVVLAITGIIVGFIALGIFFVFARANRDNMLVDFVLDVATWLTTPFHELFVRADWNEAVLLNWGLAAIVYAIIGGVIARLARG
jgi:hypothetical protein